MYVNCAGMHLLVCVRVHIARAPCGTFVALYCQGFSLLLLLLLHFLLATWTGKCVNRRHRTHAIKCYTWRIIVALFPIPARHTPQPHLRLPPPHIDSHWFIIRTRDNAICGLTQPINPTNSTISPARTWQFDWDAITTTTKAKTDPQRTWNICQRYHVAPPHGLVNVGHL